MSRSCPVPNIMKRLKCLHSQMISQWTITASAVRFSSVVEAASRRIYCFPSRFHSGSPAPQAIQQSNGQGQGCISIPSSSQPDDFFVLPRQKVQFRAAHPSTNLNNIVFFGWFFIACMFCCRFHPHRKNATSSPLEFAKSNVGCSTKV